MAYEDLDSNRSRLDTLHFFNNQIEIWRKWYQLYLTKISIVES